MGVLRYDKAYWLVQNTVLTDHQIAAFCELNPLEVLAIRKGESRMVDEQYDLVQMNELTIEEIKRCEADSQGVLKGINVKKPVRKRSAASKTSK